MQERNKKVVSEEHISFDGFCDYMRIAIGQNLGSEYIVSDKETMGYNDCKRRGLVIKASSINIAPIFYLDELYDDYTSDLKSLDEIEDGIITAYYLNAMHTNFEVDLLSDWKLAKDQIVMRLINYENNKSLLEDVPYILWNDLAIVFLCMIDEDNNGIMTTLIDKSQLEKWGVTDNELWEKARENTRRLFPPVLHPMNEILLSNDVMFDEDIEKVCRDAKMYVLGNKRNISGAVTMLYEDVLEEVSRTLKNDLVIIPSSIHELIIIPNENSDYEALKGMVAEVNEIVVNPRERLSNNIYIYSMETKTITMY